MSVLLIGTLDTKGAEFAYVRDRLRAAGQAVLDAHENLRSGFRHLSSGRPVAVVPRTAVLPWRQLDLKDGAPDTPHGAETHSGPGDKPEGKKNKQRGGTPNERW